MDMTATILPSVYSKLPFDPLKDLVPLCILTDVTTDMLVLQEETFGPILSVLAYDTLEDALALIAAQPHPLSAYYFGHDPAEEREVVERVVAGNMVVNDVRCQLFFEQLPFGGAGKIGTQIV